MSRLLCVTLLLAPFILSSFGEGNTPAVTPTPPTPPPPTAASTIKHIVIIMQENRSFDDLFMGFPGADTVTSGMSKGSVVPLQPVPYEQGTDLYHGHEDW